MNRLFFLIALMCCLNVSAQKVKTEKITKETELKPGSCTITVDFPSKTSLPFYEALRDALVNWVDASYSMSIDQDNPPSLNPQMKVINKADMEKYMEVYSQNMATYLHSSITDDEFFDQNDSEIGGSVSIDIIKTNDYPKYVCYESLMYDFPYGAAHGVGLFDRMVFSKEDRCAIEVLDSSKAKAFEEYVVSNIRDFTISYCVIDKLSKYDEEEREDVINHIQNCDDLLDLSVQWIDKKYLHLQFQVYSLVAFALGSPVISIPLKKAKPYLSQQALKLIR